MSYSEKIYKKDNKGNIRYLHIYVYGNTLCQESGILGTDNPVTHASTCKAKNIGKSNETTPEQQAVLEATSKIENKLSEGYFKSIEECKSEVVILPMLAKDYKKEFKKVKFPCYVQPKLDGMRALGACKKSLISRKGNNIDTMSHIQKEIDSLNSINTLDGELYVKGESFQENMKLIKKYRKGESERIKYHVYDIVLPNIPFRERCQLLNIIIGELDHISLVPTYQVNNEKEILKYHEEFISKGYEGTMIRHSNEGYTINKRSSQLLKYKDFIDEVYEVIDIVPSEKNPEQGVVICKIIINKGGKIADSFGCGMKFNHTDREEILKNKHDYIGKMAEIRFFEFTDDGLPRFPICWGFRLDK